jgi:hypothetical protein
VKFNSLLISLIASSFLNSKANFGYSVNGEHAGAMLAIHLKDMLNCFELTYSCSIAITANNASSNYSMTPKLQLTLEAS